MVRIGPVLILGGIAVSIAIAMLFYIEYQPNFITVNEGQPVQVGPVKYSITYEGQHNGNEDTRPKHSFFKIRIVAENMHEESTKISGLQFSIIDDSGKKTEPIYGEFSEEDLLIHTLESHKPQSFTTQFDVPFDENKQYKIGIEPRKEQSSRDIAIVCVLNC